MQSDHVAVVVGGVALIAWLNWYFFLATRRGARARMIDGGGQEVTVVVRGGYDPAIVRVQAGIPVRVTFDRQEQASCSDEVIFPTFGIRRFLRPHTETVVDLPASAAGSYPFTCGMSMLHGTIVVVDPGEAQP